MTTSAKITIEARANASINKVWQVWNNPADIMIWSTPDPSWHTPSAENDLREGGHFKNRMEAKDGSFGFDFEGTYDKVDMHKEIAYTMPDGRTAVTVIQPQGDATRIATTFDPENINDPEFQKQGWQAILDSFVKYVEERS